MSRFGKARLQREAREQQQRKEAAAAECAVTERQRQRHIREVERWGFGRKRLAAVGADETTADLKYASFFAEYIEPFKRGTLDFPKLANFLRLVATDEGHPEIARTHPDFPALVLRTLDQGKRDWWTSVSLKPFCRFTYPSHFHLILNRLDEADQSFLGDARPAALAISAIALLDEKSKLKAKGIILEAARQLSLFDLAFLACVEHGWLADLEQVLREGDRFEEVLKVLLFQNQWDAVLEWLRQNRRFADCAKVMEKLGRFCQAAELLKRLGPEATGYSEKALAKEVTRLLNLSHAT
jgi:hypothetical protein